MTPLEEGRSALRHGEWQAAREAFERALVEAETPEALEGLGQATWWLDDAAVTFEMRERAYRLYAERGDRVGAGRVATEIARDYEIYRGERAVANGWVQRARRQLEGFESTSEYGWLVLREGEFAIRSDTGEGRRLALEGVEVGKAVGSLDLEMTGRSLEGLALVSEGAIDQGMKLLDEATAAAVAGELTDLHAIGMTCCHLVAACERIGDYERAVQWCARLTDFAERWHIPTLFSVCRTQYASVMLECGSWAEAESTLIEATAVLAARRPAQTVGGIVRLAELRRRQGRRDEAAALFAQAERHPLSLLGRAELALEAGDRASAEELTRSYLRAVAKHDLIARAAGLELLVRIDPSSEAAGAALDELREVARTLATPPLRASAAFAEALVNRERERMEEAVDLFRIAGRPYETARAQGELARLTGEVRHAQAAQQTLERLGVTRHEPGVLTRREVEVLRLVADGLSDPEIADRLVLSEHTVHRHMANIRRKLGRTSRAAAAAEAARLGLV